MKNNVLINMCITESLCGIAVINTTLQIKLYFKKIKQKATCSPS